MIHCYVDEAGAPRVDAKGARVLIGTFLEQDVQGSVASCDEFLNVVGQIANGTLKKWSGTGNAHTVTLSRRQAVIENEWDESLGKLKMPLADFALSLLAWRSVVAELPK